MNAVTREDPRYEAIRTRDPRTEGTFLYSVVTTGVYCRPTCKSRLPRPENVGYHASYEDAERAGYRACKRCRPRDASAADAHRALIEKARELLSSADDAMPLAELASRLGISPFHLHRLFKQHVGMTPRAFSAAHRLKRASNELARGRSVTSAWNEAGYGSSSRFYAGASAFGMSPRSMRDGGKGVVLERTVRACSLGRVLVAATERGVAVIAFGEDRASLDRDLAKRFPRAEIAEASTTTEALADAVVAMIDASGSSADLPLDVMGTAFQLRVWRALRDIAPGETVSYGELAARIGSPAAVRAVGTACGQNPLAFVVPCHRVKRGDGSLGGYRWGLARKRALLERERR